MKSSRPLIILVINSFLLTVVLIFWNMSGAHVNTWDARGLTWLARVTGSTLHGGLPQQSWSLKQLHGLLTLLSLLLGLAALPKTSWLLYTSTCGMASGLLALAWFELARQTLFPLASMLGSFGLLAFGLMAGLHYVGMKERALVRAFFGVRLSTNALQRLLARPEQLQLHGEEREVTIFTVRLHESATRSRRISAEARVKLMREFYAEMSALILKEEGFVVRHWGNTVTAVFGAPLFASNHAEQAVRAALQAQRRLLELYKQWERVGLPAQRCLFGIHTGNALLGNFGSAADCDYSVFGASVNFAERLCEANEKFATTLLVSESTLAALPVEGYRARCLELEETIKIYEVYGDLATYRSPIDARYYQNYEKAFAAYTAQDWDSARAHLAAALQLLPNDPAALALFARVDTLDVK